MLVLISVHYRNYSSKKKRPSGLFFFTTNPRELSIFAKDTKAMDKSLQIFGIHALQEALANDQTLDKVWIQQGDKSPLLRQLENKLRAKGVATSYVPKEKFNAYKNENHQGVMGRISPVTVYTLEDILEKGFGEDTPLLLLLDHITDPHNLGAILRSAAATGVHCVVLPESGSAPLNATTVKTSAGAIFEVPIAKVSHLKDAIFLLQAHDIPTVGLDEKASEIAYNRPLEGPIAVVMGSEEKGIHPSLLKLLDRSVRMPMVSKVGSLNVSVATGLILYEIIRQRDHGSTD